MGALQGRLDVALGELLGHGEEDVVLDDGEWLDEAKKGALLS